MKYLIVAILISPLFSLAQPKRITLEDLYQRETFKVESFSGFHSMADGRYYSETSLSGIIKRSFFSGDSVETLIQANEIKDENGTMLSLKDIEWSNDEKKLLIFTKRERIYRRSSKAIVYAYDLLTKKTVKIDTVKILHATYSPDGSKVAFVKNNNLYYKDLQSNSTTQITKDGEWNKIINGNSDWVYEEELKVSKAFQWSKSGQYIAYYKFNETKVPEYNMPLYKDYSLSNYSYKYPIAGEDNSTVEIHMYNLNTSQDIIADIGLEKDIYIPKIKWSEDEKKLGIAWMNRLQNHLQWMLADAETGKTTVVYDETNMYYVEVIDNIYFLKDGKRFILTSEKDGYRNIYLNDIVGTKSIQLTKTKFDIDEILGVNEKLQLIYFTSAYPNPMQRQLFALNYANKNSAPKQITHEPGTHRLSFSSDFSYYVDNYSTINQPPVISINNSKGEIVRTIKNNSLLNQKLNEYSYSQSEFIKVPTSKGDTLNGWLLKPFDFDSNKKYPLLLCNYGGPGSQRVIDGWGTTGNMWQQYLSQNGYIIACIDNTGTGFRGEEFKKKTYLQLGKLEIEDQIDAAKYLGSLKYIDQTRIGHWGWSYGGFMSCLAITKGADVFKMAVAVAPVTNWRFYDNIYTERYMRTPTENGKGYDENAPSFFTKNMKGKFLIIHGTADDNVHFQNSALLIDKMIQNNIDFESAYYPNKNHSISGGNTSLHIYKKMSSFIFANL